MDRLWFPAHHCERDDAAGLWDCKDLPAGPGAEADAGELDRLPALPGSAPRTRWRPSLVMVTFDMPYSVSGITERNYHGTGLIVDAQRGLVVVDRNTVPVAVGDVTMTFAGTVQVPGRVVYIHPLHNFAVVAYDPKLIGTTPVKSARLTPRELAAGEPVWVVGLGGDSQLHARSTEIASIDPLELPLSRTMRFRDSNIETVQLVNPPLRLRRRAGGQGRQRARHLVELRLRERPRDRPGDPRRADRRGRGHARSRARRSARCTRSRPSSGVQPLATRARDRPAGELDAAPGAAHPDAPPGAQRGAPGGRLAGRAAAAAGRPAAGHRRRGGDALPRGRDGRGRQGPRAGDRVARPGASRPSRCRPRSCPAPTSTAWWSGPARRCRRRIAP